METAGRAVVFSGTTVAIGLLALVVLPLPFLRSRRLRRHADPARQRRSSRITLLPVVLATIGPRLDWPHMRTRRQGQPRVDRAGRGSSCAAAGSPRVGAVVDPRGARARRPRTCSSASPNADTIAKPGDAKQGLDRAGALGHRHRRAAARTRCSSAGRARRRGRRRAAPRVDGVHGAVAPPRRDWRRDGTAVVDAFRDRRRLDAGRPRRARARARRARTPTAPDVARRRRGRPRTPTSSTPSTATSR